MRPAWLMPARRIASGPIRGIRRAVGLGRKDGPPARLIACLKRVALVGTRRGAATVRMVSSDAASRPSKSFPCSAKARSTDVRASLKQTFGGLVLALAQRQPRRALLHFEGSF